MTLPHLNRRLRLESSIRRADQAGGFSESWQLVGTVWAAVDARTGRERAGISAPVSAVGYRIFVRGAPQQHPLRPVPGQRFREGQRSFAIQAVTEWDAQGRYLVCYAEEEVAA
jgi:SPP1 family predicted phage head-tail adaptor